MRNIDLLLHIKFYKDLKLFTINKKQVSINETIFVHKNYDVINEVPQRWSGPLLGTQMNKSAVRDM